jgi:DNA-directed RNA polymerase subunit M/transcription elongation factor TFIIS
MKLCPKCNTEMITVNNKHDKIKGFCGKCNHAIYLANINKKIIYKCAKLNKQIDEVLSNCIAI